MCSVCGRHAVETRLYNCQHAVTCRRCARTARRCPACGERVLCFLTLWGQGDCPPMPSCLWRTRSVPFHTVRAGRLHAIVLPSPHLSTFFFLFRFWKKSEQSVNARERQEGERVEAEMVLDTFSSQDSRYKNVTVKRMKVTHTKKHTQQKRESYHL